MEICAKFNLSFGCNGAICHGSHSEATSKLQENQTIFAILFVKQTIIGNVVWLSCHKMVMMIIYSTGDDDDSMICQCVTFQGCFEHQVLRLAKESDQNETRFYSAWQNLVVLNQSDLICRWMDDIHREAAHWVVFTSYWTGSVPPEHSSCSAAWRGEGGEEGGRGDEIGGDWGQKQKCLKGRRGLNTQHLDSLEVRPFFHFFQLAIFCSRSHQFSATAPSHSSNSRRK